MYFDGNIILLCLTYLLGGRNIICDKHIPSPLSPHIPSLSSHLALCLPNNLPPPLLLLLIYIALPLPTLSPPPPPLYSPHSMFTSPDRVEEYIGLEQEVPEREKNGK
jgi:hypothetical protein